MMTTQQMIDETLLEARTVLRIEGCYDGMGYDVDLSCGHSVWFAVEPPRQTQCGLCLDKLITQAREVQARQRPR